MAQRLSIAERREKLRKQMAAMKAQEAALAAKQSSEERKLDTRRKIVLGGAVMAHAALDPDFAKLIRSALKSALAKAKEKDRAIVQDWIQ